MKMIRDKRVKAALFTLTQILGFKFSERYVCSKIFLIHLKNHVFQNLTDKDNALRAYCEIVLNRKRKSILFSNSKFDDDDFLLGAFCDDRPLIPKWYLEATVIKNEYVDEESPLFKHQLV